MRNRAKCKQCGDILESFVMNDIVQCKCGAIAIAGGTQVYKVYAEVLENILRIDDDDKEIIPIIMEKPAQEKETKPTRDELLLELERMIDNIDKLPPEAKMNYINHYDLGSALLLLSAILRSD